jgi:hypothetical protein
MNLVEFPEQTIVIAKDQPQYRPMPAHQYAHDAPGRIVCCWQLTWRERLVVLFLGRIWHQVLTFNQALQPQLLMVDKPAMARPEDLRKLVVRINGRRFPNAFLVLNPQTTALGFTRIGRALARVMHWIPGSDLPISVTFPQRAQP